MQISIKQLDRKSLILYKFFCNCQVNLYLNSSFDKSVSMYTSPFFKSLFFSWWYQQVKHKSKFEYQPIRKLGSITTPRYLLPICNGVRNSSIITSLRTPIRKWGVHIHSIYHLFFSHIFSGIGYLCKLKRYLTYFYFLASHCTSVQKYYQIFP